MQLGEYLLEHGAIGERVLDKALEAQADAQQTSFGEILVELEVVSADVLERLVFFGIEQLGFEPPVGMEALRSLLLEHGFASRSELDAAEKHLATRRRTRIGEVLVEMNAIDHSTLEHALRAQRNPGSGGTEERAARRAAGRPRQPGARRVVR